MPNVVMMLKFESNEKQLRYMIAKIYVMRNSYRIVFIIVFSCVN